MSGDQPDAPVTPAALLDTAEELFSLQTRLHRRPWLKPGQQLIGDFPAGRGSAVSLIREIVVRQGAGRPPLYFLAVSKLGPNDERARLTQITLSGDTLPLLAEAVARAMSLEIADERQRRRRAPAESVDDAPAVTGGNHNGTHHDPKGAR
jgi:hypothetical protein